MTLIPYIPVLIPLIVAMNVRKNINRFRNTGTTTPQASKTPEELNLRRSLIFQRLQRRNVIIETSPGRYYLHEDNLAEYVKAKRTLVLIIFAVLILILLLLSVYIKF